MPRKQREELAFGSDSFLDVVANIVGILIILMILVGVRVARAPAVEALKEKQQEVAAAPLVADDIAEEVESESADEPLIVENEPVSDPPQAERPAPPPLPDLPPWPELQPPVELVQQADEQSRENESLTAELQRLQAESAELTTDLTEQERQVSRLRLQISERSQQLRHHRTQISDLAAETASLHSQVAVLEQDLSAAQAAKPPVTQLTHRLPPIGRVVTGQETHFRLANNRISHVPVALLAEQVQEELHRRKELLLTRPFFQGTTPAIDGYLMDFRLERESSGIADELRRGRGIMTISVRGWVIRPTPDLVSESLDEALQPGSRFLRALLKEGPSATVTFWVYPDSFEIHQQLKSLVHESGFWVASRPLPDGVPIAGSPHGSKSLAQ